MRVCPRIESFIRILVRQERGCEAGLKGDQVSHSFKKNFFYFFFLFFFLNQNPPPGTQGCNRPHTHTSSDYQRCKCLPMHTSDFDVYTSCIPVPHTGTHYVLRKLKIKNIRFSSHAPLIFSTIPCKGDFFLNESQRYHIYRATELPRLI